MEENRYKAALDRVRLTEDAKDTLALKLAEQAASAAPAAPARRRLSRTAVCLLAACVALLTLCAATVLTDTLREFWGADAAVIYDDNHQVLNRSQTVDGWTVTLTDAVCDDNYAYIGFTVEPPVGKTMQTTLKWPNPDTGALDTIPADYAFLDYDIDSATREQVAMSRGVHQLPSESFSGEKRAFSMQLTAFKSFNHDTYDITLGRLYHLGDWDPSIRSGLRGFTYEDGWFQETIDVPGTFSFPNVRIDCPDATRRVAINQTVPMLDGEATLETVEVSPLSLRLVLQGGSIFGVRQRDTVWKKSGLTTCLHPVTLHFADGTSQSLATYGTFDGEPVYYTHGSGGSWDDLESGTVCVVRKFDTLIDPDTLVSLTIDDVEIPLK